MNTVTTKDGTQIYYKDWGVGQPIVFSHGWPLSADDWDAQMSFFLNHGYRVIAHDRRGHGRSAQTDSGHDMDHYADDLAALTAHLDLKNAVHVGHSTGGGEVVHYLARHGQSRVAKAVIISAVPPLMVKTPANPGGLPKEVFDGFQAALAANLGGTAMSTPVVRDDAIAVLEEEQHLRVPIIRRQRPTMTEDNGLSFAPVFEVDLRAVFGGNRVHVGEILTFTADLRIGRWTEGVLLLK